MAKLTPSIPTILEGKVPPTEGELYLLNFLQDTLDDSYEVFFNPFMNGDRPDVVVLRKNHGMIIIEVKDWHLSSYTIDEKGKWYLASDSNQSIYSPLSQVNKYKDNLFDLHINGLIEAKIKQPKMWHVVSRMVYFHHASADEIQDKIIDACGNSRKYNKFVSGIDLLSRESLTKDKFSAILRKRGIIYRTDSKYFTEDWYDKIKEFLLPTRKLMNPSPPPYTNEQDRIIVKDTFDRRTLKVSGVAGSGKTTVMAARAVYLYNELINRGNKEPKVLIVMYNITLINYMKGRLNETAGEFEWKYFHVINYHELVKGQLLKAGIEIRGIGDFHSKEEIDRYFEETYYGNEKLFARLQDQLDKYDIILVDETQDFHLAWLNILKSYMLFENGFYELYLDSKQNIYNNPLENKEVRTNIQGRPNLLKQSFRFYSKISTLAEKFQDTFLNEKYEIPNISEPANLFSGLHEDPGSIRYIHLPSNEDHQWLNALYQIVSTNIGNFDTSRNDITILGSDINTLCIFDAYYRFNSNEKTKCMFELQEIRYTLLCNKITDKDSKDPRKETILGMIQELGIASTIKNLKDRKAREVSPVAYFAFIKSLIDFSESYSSVSYIDDKLERYCEKFTAVSRDECMQIFSKHSSTLGNLEKETLSLDYRAIRKSRKRNFYPDPGMIKLSTIHSFKGWESESLVLVVNSSRDLLDDNSGFKELIYTGITRAKKHLLIINIGNESMDEHLRPLIEE